MLFSVWNFCRNCRIWLSDLNFWKETSISCTGCLTKHEEYSGWLYRMEHVLWKILRPCQENFGLKVLCSSIESPSQIWRINGIYQNQAHLRFLPLTMPFTLCKYNRFRPWEISWSHYWLSSYVTRKWFSNVIPYENQFSRKIWK